MKETDLILSISPEYPDEPFYFESTGIRVYSLEEALYHAYHYFAETLPDFLSGSLISWIEDQLGLDIIASKLKVSLEKNISLTEKYIDFLSIADYFDENELVLIRNQIFSWETREQWLKFKEQGENYFSKDPKKALLCYLKAVEYSESAALYNNLGLCYMKLMNYKESENALIKAYQLESDNVVVMLNLVSVLILQKRVKDALELLHYISALAGDTDLYYYYGEIWNKQGDFKKAKQYYLKALESGAPEDSYVKLCDIFIGEKNLNDAISIIEPLKLKNPALYYYKLAQIDESGNDVHKAIKNIEKSLLEDKDNIDSWVYYAYLNRILNNYTKASTAAQKALFIDPDNEKARFENAKIKKAQGKIKDYQLILKSIIENWKLNYR